MMMRRRRSKDFAVPSIVVKPPPGEEIVGGSGEAESKGEEGRVVVATDLGTVEEALPPIAAAAEKHFESITSNVGTRAANALSATDRVAPRFKPQCFVYGEISFHPFSLVLRKVRPDKSILGPWCIRDR